MRIYLNETDVSCSQSHYVEVAQGGVSSRAIHNWLWMFSLLLGRTKLKTNHQTDIMQLFSADTIIFLEKLKKQIEINCPWKHEKMALKICP